MLFSLRELVQWLGFATFEIFVHLLALLVFSVLLALRVDGLTPGLSWWNVFVPFFAADGLSTYFTPSFPFDSSKMGRSDWLCCASSGFSPSLASSLSLRY